MEYIFSTAIKEDLPRILELIDLRIRWMDQVGIRQWNVTDYQTVYPESHYLEHLEQGRLFVLRRGTDNIIIAAAVLYETDPRWPDSDTANAYYVHHFVADTNEKGSGAHLLQHLEHTALAHGKPVLRLDCKIGSQKLNAYYKEKGYVFCGTCVDGKYSGNLQEKRLK